MRIGESARAEQTIIMNNMKMKKIQKRMFKSI